MIPIHQLTPKQRTILEVAEKQKFITLNQVRQIYSTKEHSTNALKLLVNLGYLKIVGIERFEFIEIKSLTISAEKDKPVKTELNK